MTTPITTGEAPAPEGHWRVGGYAPIRDYAAIGDGRTVALVARDGQIDWLALPDLDSPSVLAAVLDAQHGGCFSLSPEVPFETERRYLPDTNVLQTTFRTGAGAVRVTDALTLPDGALGPMRELQRQVDGLAGQVTMRWRVQPRFSYGQRPTRIACPGGISVATSGSNALAISMWGAGQATVSAGEIGGRFEVTAGSRAAIALCAATGEPLVYPARSELEARLEHTISAWRRWTQSRSYDGPWREAVLRSILALKLLVFAPSGAVAAAATTSLPETVGGERNWDYRFCWVRDSAFTLDAFLTLGCPQEAHAYFWWLMHASQLTHPRLQVLYRLDGGPQAVERELRLAGYRGSRPVRSGNAAAGQLQLDTYGELLATAQRYAQAYGRLDRDIAARLVEITDFVCQIWRRPDAGMWEVRSGPQHFTQSKMMCWIALDRALQLAHHGHLRTRHTERWTRERDAIQSFIEDRCFSETHASYMRAADRRELDAGVLLGLLRGYGERTSGRWRQTVDTIRRELSDGTYVQRYSGKDGLSGAEGAFLACSFWLAEALARTGRLEAARALMDRLVGLANDVGLYAEEIDPRTGAFLGNIPQGLSHLALISAASAIAEGSRR